MSTQRTENHILNDLRAAQESYASMAADPNSTRGKLAEAGAAVKDLTLELDKHLTQGANACECGNAPMGMLKTPAYYDQARGIDSPAIWEVGCIHCPPVVVEREDGKSLLIEGKPLKVKRRSRSARALSPQEAVRKWNEGEWVEDFLFERIPGFKVEHV